MPPIKTNPPQTTSIFISLFVGLILVMLVIGMFSQTEIISTTVASGIWLNRTIEWAGLSFSVYIFLSCLLVYVDMDKLRNQKGKPKFFVILVIAAIWEAVMILASQLSHSILYGSITFGTVFIVAVILLFLFRKRPARVPFINPTPQRNSHSIPQAGDRF